MGDADDDADAALMVVGTDAGESVLGSGSPASSFGNPAGG